MLVPTIAKARLMLYPALPLILSFSRQARLGKLAPFVGAPLARREKGRCFNREHAPSPNQGHSKNPSGYGFDCVGAIFPEVFAGLGDGPAKASDQSDGGVP